MADGEKKPPLSLNQLHNRFLLDRSASQSTHKPVSLTSSSSSFQVSLNDDVEVCGTKTQLKVNRGKASKSIGDNDEVPRFDFGTPSPPSQGFMESKELESKREDSFPNMFAGITDFDSPSPAQDSNPHESHLCTEEDRITHEINPTIFDSCNHNTGEKPVKLRIEGRRRLCKFSANNNSDTGLGKTCVKTEEPNFEGISDFDSPDQVNKAPCESSGNEIRDILNDLSSRLEILSIEKKKVPPEKAEFIEGYSELTGSKLYDVIIKDSIPENESAVSSSLLSSNALGDSCKVSKVGGGQEAFTNEHHLQHLKNNDVGIANRNVHHLQQLKNNAIMGSHAEESHLHHFKRVNTYSKSERHVALSECQNVKQVNRKQGKIIELSDDESEEDMLDDHIDDFTLNGLKCTYKLPGKIAKMLFPHQREGLKWLWSLHSMGKGGILGDDMGLGKTMQICGFIAGLFYSNLIKRVLVVAPKTLLTHWANELSVVGLSEKTREYFATCARTRHYELQYVLQDKGVLLTTYDIVRNNVKSLCGDYNKGYDGEGEEDEATWDYMILDEGHLIKNPSTQRAKSLLQIPCRHRVIISGTPLQNNLKELWALFHFCCPELLGDKKEFKENYEHFISRGNEKNASDREKRIGSSVAKKLRDCIQPYFLRRMKCEVFRDDTTLSKKNEIVIWLRLTQCQRQLYEAFLKSEIVISACDGSPLAALTILKKICDHPLLLTKRAAEDVLEGMDSVMNQEDHRVAEKLAMHIADVTERFDIVEKHDISCKISFVLSVLGDLVPKGHNVLIFSQTRKMLNLIQECLISNEYQYIRIDGTTKASDRAKIVKDFQEGHGAQIFLLTSQVGGLGLTLTNADRVIVVDPAWNPSTDNQIVDRAYRIGQTKDVIVYRLMTCGTVEEKIYRKQVFKGGLFRSATEHKEQTRYFSQQDLRDLFSLPKQGFDVSPTQQQLLEEHDRQHTMEESLKTHVKFLETLNIAGVSQHSLLFSKTAPIREVEVEEEVGRLKENTVYGKASTCLSREQNVDGADYAFKPKDVNMFHWNSSPAVVLPSETEIKDKINRLSQLLANKAVVSNLSDRGEKLHKQIAELSLQLDRLQMTKRKDVDVIEL